jgi:hypothetical protein
MGQERTDDKGVAGDGGLGGPVLGSSVPLWKKWPRGWVALAVIALGWVGVYLLWNGVVFLLQV